MVVFGLQLREAAVFSGKLSGNRTLAGQLCRVLFGVCVLTVLCSLAPALSSAAQVTLAWDANTDPNVAGYKLYYGISSGSYQFSVDVGNQTSYTLSGLLEGQTYYFTAIDYNLSLNESGFSNEVSKAIPDVTPPTVSIGAPANGVTVSGTTVTVSASASDNVGVAGVQFMLDGVNLGAQVTAAPYAVSWNTPLGADGAHTLTAVARDAAGNTATSAARLYWENARSIVAAIASGQKPPELSLPVAFTVFPGEIFQAPRSWADKVYPNLIYFNEADKGGHFAAWEEPELFASEVRAAFRSLR